MNTILLYIIVNVGANCHVGPCMNKEKEYVSCPYEQTVSFTTSREKAYKAEANKGGVEVYSISLRGVVKRITTSEVVEKMKLVETHSTVFVPPPTNKGGDR